MSDEKDGITLTREEYKQVIEALARNGQTLQMLCEKVDKIWKEISHKVDRSELKEVREQLTKQIDSKISANGYTWIRESLDSLHKRLDDFEDTYEKELEILEKKVNQASSLSTAVRAWKWVLITYGGLILLNFSLLVTIITKIVQFLK